MSKPDPWPCPPGAEDPEAMSPHKEKERSAVGAIFRDAWRDTPEWRTSRWYHIGDRVRFAGMMLRCGVDHYCGDAANHPWDPGWGWGDGAAQIWTVLSPEGMSVEADAARTLAEASRERGAHGA